MVNIFELIEQERKNGYSAANATAKVCQDMVLEALAASTLSRNATIKGGVVMRSKTQNVRRATQDLDIDFIRYSLSDASIDRFIAKLNCIPDITFSRIGDIEELKQQDYHGKRVHILVKDTMGHELRSKIDLGVHNRLEIEQEEYCFDIAFDNEGASLLINSNEQMFSEKLRSLLKFGSVSTRYKDVFDLYYLSDKLDADKLAVCMNSYIFGDPQMRENNMGDVIRRIKIIFNNRIYRHNLETTDKKWMDEKLDVVLDGLVGRLENYLEN